MPNSPAHLTDLTLEQLAEDLLPGKERAAAEEHLGRCSRCAAELEGYRALFVALSDLPRFAPSEAFTDSVMARVRMAPEPDPLYARLVQWVPDTRRGWALLTATVGAPAAALMALLGWFFSQPMVSASAIWQWTTLQVSGLASAAGAQLSQWAASLGILDGINVVYGALASVPLATLIAVVAVLAVAIPLSAWSLVRLVRSPMEEVTYAN